MAGNFKTNLQAKIKLLLKKSFSTSDLCIERAIERTNEWKNDVDLGTMMVKSQKTIGTFESNEHDQTRTLRIDLSKSTKKPDDDHLGACADKRTTTTTRVKAVHSRMGPKGWRQND